MVWASIDIILSWMLGRSEIEKMMKIVTYESFVAQDKGQFSIYRQLF